MAQLVHDSKRILSQTGDRYKQEKALIDGIEKELAKASNATYLPTQ